MEPKTKSLARLHPNLQTEKDQAYADQAPLLAKGMNRRTETLRNSMAGPALKSATDVTINGQLAVRSSLPLQRRNEKVVENASEISEDEWGEIQRYGDIVAQEKKRQERNQFLNK